MLEVGKAWECGYVGYGHETTTYNILDFNPLSTWI